MGRGDSISRANCGEVNPVAPSTDVDFMHDYQLMNTYLLYLGDAASGRNTASKVWFEMTFWIGCIELEIRCVAVDLGRIDVSSKPTIMVANI